LLHAFVAEAMSFEADATLRLLKREELTMPLMATLRIVERQGSSSISEISACLECSLGNSSMVVDRLVHNGFVTRVEDTHDRRHKQVQLTEKGRAFVNELRATRVEGMAQRILLLPADLRDRMIDVLRDVTAQLSSTEHARA
jgi:DNA-binding MarR family transcriptional regulator